MSSNVTHLGDYSETVAHYTISQWIAAEMVEDLLEDLDNGEDIDVGDIREVLAVCSDEDRALILAALNA